MPIMLVDSWNVAGTRQMARSVTFYQKTLGLKPTMKSKFYSEFAVPGGTTLGLHQAMGGQKTRGAPKRKSAGWAVLLRVKDLEKTVAALRKKRVRCSRIETAPGGARFSRFMDPDGNPLTLVAFPKKK